MWVEHLKQGKTEYQKYSIKDHVQGLSVGTTDRVNVEYIALSYSQFGDSNSEFETWFFKNGNPRRYKLNRFNQKEISGIPARFSFDFEELGIQVPSLKPSLEKCISKLLKREVKAR